MRLAPPAVFSQSPLPLCPRRTETLPFPSLSFSLQPPTTVRTRPGHPSVALQAPAARARSLDTARYQPSSLYSANVYPIFLLRSTCAPVPLFVPTSLPPSLSPHLHAIMYPFLVFPALSSTLISPLPVEGFPRFSPPLKSMPVCSRPFHHACSPGATSFLPLFAQRLPLLASFSFFGLSSLLRSARFHARICTRFSLPLSISVRSRASMCSTCVHLRVNPPRPFFSSCFIPFVDCVPSLPRLPATPYRHDRHPARGYRPPCVTLRLAYVSISRRLLHTIDTLSRPACMYVCVLLDTRGALNSNKIPRNFAYYISAKRTHILYLHLKCVYIATIALAIYMYKYVFVYV